jgi:type II secretory ATPase GspE/PulE/Tfp pilus assembly ATPase PilB-like protein
MLGRAAHFMLVGAYVGIPLGFLTLWIGLAPSDLTDFRHALVWYSVRQWQLNPLLLPFAIAAGFFAAAWAMSAAWGRRAYHGALKAHALPARETIAIDRDRLVRQARHDLEAELSRNHPRVEHVIDLLLALPGDYGASSLVVREDQQVATITLRIGMDELPISSMSRDLLQRICARLAAMLELDPAQEVARGTLEYHAPHSVQQLRVERRIARGGTTLRVDPVQEGIQPRAVEELGIPEEVKSRLFAALDRDRGLVLINGPVGHGTTTTLYAAAHYIYRTRQVPGLIVSIEETVQRELPFLTQIELGDADPKLVLQRILPEKYGVLLIRDIRIPDFASEVFSQASSRCLVVGSVGATGAVGGIVRAVELSSPSQIADLQPFALAQRIVRKLCTKCRRSEVPSAEHRAVFPGLREVDHARFRAAEGCVACNGTGYRSNVAFFEVLPPTEALLLALREWTGPESFRRAAAVLVDPPLGVAGIALARAGVTSLDELVRALGKTD